jgi:G3E family GTPase
MSASGLTPVTVLTGFLGSGKTTLLNELVRSPLAKDSALIINEWGTVAVDHALVRQAAEDIVVLDSGCICCTVAGELMTTLRDLYFRRARGEVPPFRRVLIETTGLADPTSILHTLIQMPLVVARYSLAGVATTVDAEHGLATLAQHPESERQVAMADRLIITKTDRASTAALAALMARLQALNPGAAVHQAVHGKVAPEAILEGGVYRLDARTPRVSEWLARAAYRPVTRQAWQPGQHATRPVPAHDQRIQSFVVEWDYPVALVDLTEALTFVHDRHGDAILRMKGVVAIAGEARPAVIHGVAHTLYPVGYLDVWPADFTPGQAALVFIVRDLAPMLIEASLKAFLPSPIFPPAPSPALHHP